MPKKFTKFWNMQEDSKSPSTLNMYVYGRITSQSGWFGSGSDVVTNEFIKDLRNHPDVDVINVYINSPGGEVFAAAAIKNQLVAHHAKVNTFVDGIAASAATVIAAAGFTTMSRSALMMIHNPATRVEGDVAALEKAIEVLGKVKETVVATYKNKTGLEDDVLAEIMDKETWLTAEEALSYGFIDKITEDADVDMCIDDDNDAIVCNGISMSFSNFIEPDALKAKINSLQLVTNKKEVKEPMNFEQIMASIGADAQAILNAHIANQIAMSVATEKQTWAEEKATMEASLKTANETVATLQTQMAGSATNEDPEQAILMSMPEPARVAYLDAQNRAAEATAKLAEQEATMKFNNFKEQMSVYNSLPLQEPQLKAMFTLSESNAEQFQMLESVLQIANSAMAAGFIPQGADDSQSTMVNGSAFEMIESKVKAKMTENPQLDYNDAFKMVITEDPALYDKYREEN